MRPHIAWIHMPCGLSLEICQAMSSLKWKVLGDIGVFSAEEESARVRVPHSAVARDRRRDAVVYDLQCQGKLEYGFGPVVT